MHFHDLQALALEHLCCGFLPSHVSQLAIMRCACTPSMAAPKQVGCSRRPRMHASSEITRAQVLAASGRCHGHARKICSDKHRRHTTAAKDGADDNGEAGDSCGEPCAALMCPSGLCERKDGEIWQERRMLVQIPRKGFTLNPLARSIALILPPVLLLHYT